MRYRIKGLVIFLVCAILVQGLALLFLTPGGLERLFPIPLRLHAEKFKPENNTYAVYYDTRVAISEAELIVVAVDPEVAESYDVLGHFSRFAKQYNNFSAVLLDFDRVSERIASGLMNETSERRFYAKLDTLKQSSGFAQDYCDYLSELFVINTTMAPVRKFEIASYSANTAAASRTLSENIALTYAESERSALCMIDAAAMDEVRATLGTLLPDTKIFYVDTLYTKDCPGDGHKIVTFPLASADGGTYFVRNADLNGFYRYYNGVTGLFGIFRDLDDRLDTRYTDYYFVISGGSEPLLPVRETMPEEEVT